MPCANVHRPANLHPDEAVSSLSEDLNNDHPEHEPERFVSILAECLALMGKLPEAIEVCFLFKLITSLN